MMFEPKKIRVGASPSRLVEVDINAPKDSFDVIIVGSGTAGLHSAIKLSKATDASIAIVSKDEIGESNSIYAQGGVAAVFGEDDDVQSHYQDTLKVGDGLSHPDIVEDFVKEAPARIQELISWGCRFDATAGKLDLGLEGAHSHKRIIHHRDSTGGEIQQVLLKKLEDYQPTFLSSTFLIDIIEAGGECKGIATLSPQGTVEFLSARAVILAGGGCGQAYSVTVNAPGATGDAIACALRARVRLRDVEFIQFHPTALKVSGPQHTLPLISEAIRGEGAHLINSKGERFLTQHCPHKELAPRDVISRAIWTEMNKGKDVFLDVRHLGEKTLRNRFPSIYATCLENRVNPLKECIPITPAAHYLMGGVIVDEWGKTDLPGLFVVGEAAATGLHGANRLASNSLGEALVFSNRVVKPILNRLKEPTPKQQSKGDRQMRKTPRESHETKLNNQQIQKGWKQLKGCMWDNVGIVRSKNSLVKAVVELSKLLDELDKHMTPDRRYYELVNSTTTGLLIAKAALAREESRGAHYRSDFPNKKASWARHIILQKKF